MKFTKKSCIIIIAALLYTFIFPLTFSKAVYDGIDVSAWQQSIDFEQVKNSGKEIVYIRAGAGLAEDLTFSTNAVTAHQAGLKIGFYFFVTASNINEAELQARYFASLIRQYHYDCRPAVDYEQFGDIPVQEINDIALSFSKTLEKETGVVPLFYTDLYNAINYWDEELARYPLWAADYSTTAPDALGIWNTWAGFQYSDSGNVAGISGSVDIDYFKEEVLLNEKEYNVTHDSPKRNQIFFRYTVKPGDTLWSLSKRFDTSVDLLAEINNIRDKNLIYIGETLLVPDNIKDVFRYEVKAGNTLSGLAAEYSTTVRIIAALNSIANPNLIYVGQILLIPR